MSGFLSVCAGLLIGHRKLILQLSRMYEQWIIKMFCGIVWKIISFYFIASEFQCYDSGKWKIRGEMWYLYASYLGYSIYIKSCVSLGGLYIIMFSISCLWSRLVFVENRIEDIYIINTAKIHRIFCTIVLINFWIIFYIHIIC